MHAGMSAADSLFAHVLVATLLTSLPLSTRSPSPLFPLNSIPEPPAPGGDCRIPSFAHDDAVLNKGVQFGHKLKNEFDIAERMGRLSRLAPGGNYRVPRYGQQVRERECCTQWEQPIH